MRIVFLFSLILLLDASQAEPGHFYCPVFALHRTATTTKTATVCTTYGPNARGIPCSSYNQTGYLGYNLIYFVIARSSSDGVTGASFGIDYCGRPGEANGIDPTYNTWFGCSDGAVAFSDGGFGDFPAPRGGVRITWSTCQTTDVAGMGIHAVAGALMAYAYAPDVLRVIPNLNASSAPELFVTYCRGDSTHYPVSAASSYTGVVYFGSDPYVCEPTVDTIVATWGQLKARYR